MKSLKLIICLIINVISKSCPKWQCDSIKKNECSEFDQSNNVLYIQEREIEGCAILPYINYLENFTKIVPHIKYYEVFQYLNDIYCYDLDLYDLVKDQCQFFKGTTQMQKHNLVFLQQKQLNQTSGFLNFEICNQDSDCNSGKCECVPSSNRIARCTTSPYDSLEY